MDGENNGKPYFLMDDLGVPLFLETLDQLDDLQKGHAPGKTLSVDWAYQRFLHRGIFPTTILATCRLHATSTLH